MKRLVGAAVVSACIWAAAPAWADVIDMATSTCREIVIDNGEEDANYFIVWLHGYLTAKAGQTTLDTNALESVVDKVSQYCQDNPQAKIMSAVSAALGG